MPYVQFEYTYQCGTGDSRPDEVFLFVHGAAEAEELAEKLREYGSRAHRHPVHGDKGVLIVNGYAVCEGCVRYVHVRDVPPFSSYKFTKYDEEIHG